MPSLNANSKIIDSSSQSQSQYQDEDSKQVPSPRDSYENNNQRHQVMVVLKEEKKEDSKPAVSNNKARLDPNDDYQKDISSYWESEFTRASISINGGPRKNDNVAAAAAAAMASAAQFSLKDPGLVAKNADVDASTDVSSVAKENASGTPLDDENDLLEQEPTPRPPEDVLQRDSLLAQENLKPVPGPTTSSSTRHQYQYQKDIASAIDDENAPLEQEPPPADAALQRGDSLLSQDEILKPAAAEPGHQYQEDISEYWESKFARSSIAAHGKNNNGAAAAAKILQASMSNEEETTTSDPSSSATAASDSPPQSASAAGLLVSRKDQDEKNRARHVSTTTAPEISKPGAYYEQYAESAGVAPTATSRISRMSRKMRNTSAGGGSGQDSLVSEPSCPEESAADEAVQKSRRSTATRINMRKSRNRSAGREDNLLSDLSSPEESAEASCIRRPPLVCSNKNDVSLKQNRGRPSLPIGPDGSSGSISMPGAYAEEGISQRQADASSTIRRNSAVEEVLAALGEDAPSFVELTISNERSSMAGAGITRSTKQFPGGTAGAANDTSLVNAELVDEEAIVYAKDVRLDFWKRNRMVLIVFGVLLCVLVIVLTIVLIPDDSDDMPPPRTGDPRCWVPIEDQLIHLRCFCSNSTHGAYEELEEKGKLIYSVLQASMTQAALWEPNTIIDPESCEPYNQVLLLGSNLQAFNNSVASFLSAPLEVRMSIVILALVYITMGGMNWIRQEGWLEINSLCDWFGIDCLFIDIVHHLALPNNAVEGTLPSQLGLLQWFRTLDLSNNTNITGTIPSELGNMSTLNSLRLSELSLTGVIPSELGALDRLDALSLNRNQLTGEIPVELFSSWQDLRYLDLGNNAFRGTIPSELGRATNLRGLRLQGNDFSGTLPDTLTQLTALELLNIGKSKFDGPIPAWIGFLPRLQFINLEQSGLTGGIPESFCNATARLTVLAACATTTPCSCCSKSPGSNALVLLKCVEDLPDYAIGIDI